MISQHSGHQHMAQRLPSMPSITREPSSSEQKVRRTVASMMISESYRRFGVTRLIQPPHPMRTRKIPAVPTDKSQLRPSHSQPPHLSSTMMRSVLRQRLPPTRLSIPLSSPLCRRAYSAAPPPPPKPPAHASAAGPAGHAPPQPGQPGQSYHDRLNAHYAARMKHNRSILLYVVGALALATATTYAAVPAYRAFCAATGYAGTPMTDPSRFEAHKLYATDESKGRPITVRFQATSSDTLPWSFTPVQKSVTVVPGQTALAFYTATNHSNQDLIGIATYNMTPEKVSFAT